MIELQKSQIRIKIFSILGILVFLLGQTVFAQELKEGVYPDGKLRYKGYFLNGKPVGEVTHYYPDGKVKAVMNHEEEKVKAVLYDKEGSFQTSGEYLNRKKNGVWEYRKDDRLLLKEEYKDDRLEGNVTRYYSSGEVAEIKGWKGGRISGTWKSFYEGGNIKMEVPFVEGRLNGRMKSYAPDGKLLVEGEYKDDLKEGAWHFYNLEKQTERTVEYHKGISKNQKAEELEETRRLDEMINSGKKIPDPALFVDEPENYMKLSSFAK